MLSGIPIRCALAETDGPDASEHLLQGLYQVITKHEKTTFSGTLQRSQTGRVELPKRPVAPTCQVWGAVPGGQRRGTAGFLPACNPWR